MTLTRRPSPFGELVTLRRAMDRLADDSVFRPVRPVTEGVALTAGGATAVDPATKG